MCQTTGILGNTGKGQKEIEKMQAPLVEWKRGKNPGCGMQGQVNKDLIS